MVLRHPKNIIWALIAFLIIVIIAISRQNKGQSKVVIEEVVMRCDKCNGDGRFYIFKCKKCGGTGKLIKYIEKRSNKR